MSSTAVSGITIASQVERIQRTAKAVASLDTLASLALVAERNGYVRPNINEKGVIDIKDGRHPVVERMIPNGYCLLQTIHIWMIKSIGFPSLQGRTWRENPRICVRLP